MNKTVALESFDPKLLRASSRRTTASSGDPRQGRAFRHRPVTGVSGCLLNVWFLDHRRDLPV